MQQQKNGFLLFLNLMNGVVSLLGWNAVLTSLDYFNEIYTKSGNPHNIYLWYPIAYMTVNTIVSALMPMISEIISYKKRFLVAILLLNIGLVLLVCFSMVEVPNYSLSIFFIVLISANNTVIQSSLYSIINYFSRDIVAIFNTGTGFSGMLISLLRIIALAIFGGNASSKQPIILYFSFNLLITLSVVVLNLYFFRSQTFLSIESKQEGNHEQLVQEGDSDTLPSAKVSKIQIFKSTLKNTSPYWIIIFVIYVQTFMLFPGLTLRISKQMFCGSYCIPLLIFIYNVGDTLGKFLTKFRSLLGKKILILILLLRFLLYITSILIVLKQDSQMFFRDILPPINMIMIALSNGFLTSGSFVLCFQVVSNENKNMSGMVNVFMLVFGIMCGTYLALPFQSIGPS